MTPRAPLGLVGGPMEQGQKLILHYGLLRRKALLAGQKYLRARRGDVTRNATKGKVWLEHNELSGK